MNAAFMESFSTHPLVVAVGWTLVHVVWQAALIGIVVATALGMMRRSAASTRYLVACAGLLLMIATPMGTLVWLVSSTDAETWNKSKVVARADTPIEIPVEPIPSSPAGVESDQQNTRNRGMASAIDGGIEVQTATAPLGWSYWIESFAGAMQGWLPWCVLIWIVGVMCLAMRLVVGLRRVWRWQRKGIEIIGGDLAAAMSRLSARMNLRQRVRLLETARDTVPAVIGWIRPAILVPASMISGLTTNELESILAHELAHVRRCDYLVNLWQTVVETLLFYHPAVWWLSNRIRAEREDCCDDIAVAVCGNRVVFAQALARMEEIRCRGERLSMAANGGSLVNRIRRIVAPQPHTTGPWWPAGVIILGSLGLMICGIWLSAVQAESIDANATALIGDVGDNSEIESADDKEFPTKWSEGTKTDSKTGIEKKVFSGIRLETGMPNDQPPAAVDMMYSNVMMYTFIPARIAKQLGAKELGEIDFGTEPPPAKQVMQTIFIPEAHELIVLEDQAETGQNKTVRAHEVLAPVDASTKIVPYPDDAVWIPGHLGFYGMNQTKQHIFRIVRIEKVDLGVGPSFGPVNALVLDDANSDFGVLGSHWVQQVRGENGEGLWFDFTGTFHFMATPGHLKTDDVQQGTASKPSGQETGKITVESSGHGEMPARLDREGVKVLASHTYPENFRESTGWVEVNGVQVPIDVGVEHDGVAVYKTLMYDIVAIDSKSEKTIWNIDWGKTMPMWKTVSIVELNRNGNPELAVELYTAHPKTRQLVYEYRSLTTGEVIEFPAVEESSPDPVHGGDKNDKLSFKTIESDGDRVSRVAINAFGHGRSATELVRHFSAIDHDISKFRGGVSTTNMETIVSAVGVSYLVSSAFEAQEIWFNLPEGSGMRAEFGGENVEITQTGNSTTIVITNGRLELIDAGGVIRAWASPDGGAEQLVVDCKKELGEVVMVMTTRRIVPIPDFPSPPVQAVLTTETGAPKDEKDPPHGGIRYKIQQGDDDGKPFVRMKMKWRYDLKRLAEEATAESGLTLEELLYGQDEEKSNAVPDQSANDRAESVPPIRSPQSSLEDELEEQLKQHLQSMRIPGSKIAPDLIAGPSKKQEQEMFGKILREFLEKESHAVPSQNSPLDIGNQHPDSLPELPRADKVDGWGDLAEISGLRSRLTLLTEQPTFGKPLQFKLEVKNFGDQPTTIDLQHYFQHHVLRAIDASGNSAKFVGMSYQTAEVNQTLQPGESVVAWDEFDANSLFVLEQGQYKFFAEAGKRAAPLRRDSNTVEVEIAAGDPAATDRLAAQLRLVAELVKDLPDQWNLSSATGAAEGWRGVLLSHSPNRTKPDHGEIQIRIWFTDEQLAEDFELGQGGQKQTVTQLGKCELGYVNVATRPATLKFWPDYLKYVRNASSAVLEFGAADARHDETTGSDDADGWGALAKANGLRSRLTLLTEQPAIGQPVLFQLEVKNFGDKPTEIDPQKYAPFRVLRAENEDFSTAAPFIGMTPQTDGKKIELQPGESHLLWKDIDVSELYLLAEGRDYFVFAEGGEWAMQAWQQDSNRVKLRLAPGELPPLQRVVADLMPRLPPGWKLSTGFNAIFVSHSPTNLKKDVTTIQLVFLDEAGIDRLNASKRPAAEITLDLGKTGIGEAFLLAPEKATKLWRDYRETIQRSMDTIRINEPQSDDGNDKPAKAIDDKPWRVRGRVSDAKGKPLADVTVQAHCGIGTLFNTGSGITDDNGRYEFTFGPGIHGGSPKMVQAATISVSLDGFTEKNLHRQGDCLAALEKPEAIAWGDKTETHLFLPDKPLEINFEMVPAVSMRGRVYVADTGKPAHDYSVSLTGPELPPSASVIDQVRVGEDGSFSISEIPAGFPFQILVEPAIKGSPWIAWASPPMVFVSLDSGNTHIEYVHQGKSVDFSFQDLYVTVSGDGTNWKTALKEAESKNLVLTWDGLSTDSMVAARMAFLELGD